MANINVRLRRAVGLTTFFSTMAAVLGLVVWPKIIGAIWGAVTWSKAEKDACAVVPDCAVNIVPGGAVSVWWAIAWVLVIAIAVIVCWQPARWWSSRGKGRIEFIADSSPQWLRVHACVAALLCCMIALPGRSAWSAAAPLYWIPFTLAIGVAVLATVNIRRLRRSLPPREFDRLVGFGIFVDRAVRLGDRRARKTGPGQTETTRCEPSGALRMPRMIRI